MSKNKPLDQIPAWAEETTADRVQKCKSMLAIYGFLPDSEARKVQERIDKWLRKNNLQRLLPQMKLKGVRTGTSRTK